VRAPGARIALGLAAVALAGCLPGVAPPAQPRYFAPLSPRTAQVAALPADPTGPLLRLRRVRGAAYLKERIAWRRTEVEVGFYELRRWTQWPAAYVQQWLERELFERRGLRHAAGGPYPVLEVDLRVFDEWLEPEHSARVELSARLQDAQGIALFERSYAQQRPVEGSGGEALARALGAALDAAVQEVGADVEAALGAAPERPRSGLP
jgi:ABC-type uncharacterized transport system auxiliary subunit